MSKITVGVPPNFSPLLCRQKNWEKIECQIEQHKKHTYNITTIGPFFFLNPQNKKNYPFMIFLPNYTLEPIPKKGNSCTISIRFPRPIPSITFLASKDEQIREIHEYITNSKTEMSLFLDNVKISENITCDGFEQFSENFSKPVKIIPNIQFMNGKWQLQTLYKEQARELKTILIESHNILALPCYEVPHKFGPNDTVIKSFVIFSKTDQHPIYFKTPDIDEMIRWILFIYAYLNNSPNAVGAPFSRMQSVPIKKTPSQSTQSISSQIQSPASITENSAKNASSIQRSQTSSGIQTPTPKLAQNPNSTTSDTKQPSVTMNSTPVSPAEQRKRTLEKRPSGQISPGMRSNAVSQMNIKKPTLPSNQDSKGQLKKTQTNSTLQQQPNTPTQSIRQSTSASPGIPSFATAPPKLTEHKKSEFSIIDSPSPATPTTPTTPATPTTPTPSNTAETTNTPVNNNENEPATTTNTNNTNNNPPKKEEPEKEEDFDFSFKFESLDIENEPVTKNETSFPDIQFTEVKKDDQNAQKNQEDEDQEDKLTSSINTSSSISSATNSTEGGRSRSFSMKRRNSNIKSQALDSIRSDKPPEVDINDEYIIPPDMEKRLEQSFEDLDKKYQDVIKNDTKCETFKAPNYNDFVSTTLVSMSTLMNPNSRTMQIKTLLNTIDADESLDVVDFPFADQDDAETVEETLSTMSSEDKIDLDSFFKFSEYPDYDITQLTNSVRPRNRFIDEFTQLDQGLRQSGSSSLDLNNFYVVRLCFLVACTIVNGLKEFTDQSSTVSIVEPLKQMSFILPEIDQIVNEIGSLQTTCEQASVAATMLIGKNLLGAFLREVKRAGEWASKYYLKSATLSNFEFLDTFVLMLEPMLNTMTFNIDSSSTIFKSASADDVNRYAYTPLFAYLEIDGLFEQGSDPVKIISKQFEVGLKKSKKFLNMTAWDVLEKLSQDQRYSASYYGKFTNSISASKAFFGSSKSKLESWISEAINSKSIHQFFMVVHINLTLLNNSDYYEESSLIDPFRANYVMKKLCKYISTK